MACPLNCNDALNQDDQQHLLLCSAIKEKFTLTEIEELNKICYSDIYKSVEHQRAAVTTFTKLLEVRAVLLEGSCSTPTPTSESTLDTATQACLGGDGD